MLLPSSGQTGKENGRNLCRLPLRETFPLYRLLPVKDRPGDEAENIGQEGREFRAGRD